MIVGVEAADAQSTGLGTVFFNKRERRLHQIRPRLTQRRILSSGGGTTGRLRSQQSGRIP
jgi:hypothetical protein